MSITFNYRSMLAETVGFQAGLTVPEIEALDGAFQASLKDLSQRRRTGELPFWDLPFDERSIEEVSRFAAEKRRRFADFVLLGIGGSALGPIALHRALNHPLHNLLGAERRGGCRFFCPDNVDPDLLGAVLDVVEPSETLFNVVSKSGGTAETAAQFLIILDILKSRLGERWREHLVLTTDPERGMLRRFARKEGVASFAIDPGVGGRFSVLTPVGLLPAAMTGINITRICAGARAVERVCFTDRLTANPPALIAALFHLAQVKKRLPIHILFAYSNRLYPVADWFRQLWAESLGKRYDLSGREVFTGPTPVKAVGATDQHSQVQLYVEGPVDKAVLFLGTKRFGRKVDIPSGDRVLEESAYLWGKDLASLLNAERRATSYALARAGRPSMSLEVDAIDPEHMGALIYLLEAATLYAGGFYNINPLDQPGVEAGKRATNALMGRKGFERERDEINRFFTAATEELMIEL